MSNGKKMLAKRSIGGSKMAGSMTPRFGIATFETSTGDLLTSIREWLTSLPAGRRVSRSPLPAVGPQPVTSEIWSPQCCERLASFDPGAYCWRTVQLQLFGDTFSSLSSLDCVKWGMWDDTGLFRLRTPSGLTAIREFRDSIMNGSEPGSSQKMRSPQASNASQGPKSRELYDLCLETGQSQITLVDQLRHCPQKLPTPAAISGHQSGRMDEWGGSGSRKMLSRKLPTPRANETGGYQRDHGDPEKPRPTLSGTVGGALNPNWEEWYMGWPVGWTDAAPLAKDRFRRWLILSRRC